MGMLRELTVEECTDLLSAGVVGRAAICTPTGPYVVPVNYAVQDDEAVVFRTTPYSVLGTYGWTGEVAFEVDQIDPQSHQGWSVLAIGHAEMVEDSGEIEKIQLSHEPHPWAEGVRALYIRVRWRVITGRRIA
jgi:nitroimidazol reductase NimA-like FMN-containing flavoprotein (pyridoxamine 5'-phosphate oxidase superfamily)